MELLFYPPIAVLSGAWRSVCMPVSYASNAVQQYSPAHGKNNNKQNNNKKKQNKTKAAALFVLFCFFLVAH